VIFSHAFEMEKDGFSHSLFYFFHGMFLIHDLSHQLALMMILKTWTIQEKIVPQHVGHLFILSQNVTVALMSIAILSVSKHHQEGRGSAANHP
jgi:hypothetical protein